MPKKVFTLNDFSGGLNTDKSSRALKDNELASCKNLDPTSKGRVVCSRVFKQDNANYTDQAGASDAVAGITSGYGLATFANDNKVSSAGTAYTGEFIAKLDGNASADVDILEPASTWGEGEIAAQSANAIFYAAEGDLFCGGDHSSVPKALVYHDHDKFEPAATTGYATPAWKEEVQDRVAPISTTDMTIHEILLASGTNITGLGADKLDWIIKYGADSTGLWNNAHNAAVDAGTYMEFGGSWLYKNGAESSITPLLTGSANGSPGVMANNATHTDATLTVQAYASAVSTSASDSIYGARLYSRQNLETEWYLLAEVNYDKGVRGDGETDWNLWTDATSGAASDFDHDIAGFEATTDIISAPPALLTFKILNGYSQGDIPTSNRKVYFKTGIIANSRAYIGNVSLNTRTYGDRILKSPVFQYDVFTEDNYLDVAINDGDQITALAAHGDRILQFKNSAVYIINVSKELEFLEDEHQGAGVGWQAAVTTTPFGVVWINNNACYLYDGEKITQLQLGKISSTNWSANIDSATPKSIIGYDSIKQQVIVLWDASSSGSGEAYIFDAETGSWYETDDILTHSVNCTNMVNARGDKLLIGGNAAVDDINFLADRVVGTTATIDLQTKVFDLGNPESKKNLLEVAVVYKYGNASLDVNISADHAAYVEAGSGSEGLLTTAAGPTLTEIDTSGQADFQGKKTFQVQIEGISDELFELHSISLTYRDLGVH